MNDAYTSAVRSIAADGDFDWSDIEAANVEEEVGRHGLYLLTNPKKISNLLLYELETYGKHRTHTPFDFRIRGTPCTKYGIILMTTDGNAVETPKRKGQYKDIYDNRLFVLEVTIPEAGEYKFSLDHCESSFQHNKKPFQYLAAQLDDNGNLPLNDSGEFVQYEKTLSSCPFWVESRDTRSKWPDDIVVPLIEDVKLQGVSIKRAFSTLTRRVTKPMAPNEEIRLREKRVSYFVLKRCKKCALKPDVYLFCSECKLVKVSEPVDVEEAGASSPLSSSSSSSSQMSEHIDQRGEGLEETSGKDLTEVSKPVDVEEAGARSFSSSSSSQMSEEDIDQTGRGPGNASRKRSYNEINQTEEAEAAVELQEIEELYQEAVLSGSGRFGDSNFLPNGDDLKDVPIVDGKVEAFSKGEWKRLFPQCASSPTSGPSSASVPEGGNSTEGDRNGIGSPQSSSSKKYPSNVEGNFPAYHQSFSSEPADKEDLDSFALFPSL